MGRRAAIKGWGVDDRKLVTLDGGKLIRDRVPKIMQAKKVEFTSHKASASEYKLKLSEKLMEEALEYSRSSNTEELADVLEVVRALCDAHKIEFSRLEGIRKTKARERGGFSKRIILDSYDDTDYKRH